jgi:rare lipoprotein A (peptidoglycan hydrolase)
MKLNKLMLGMLLLSVTACSVQKTDTSEQVPETKPDNNVQSPVPVVPPKAAQRIAVPDISAYNARGLARVYPSQLHGSLTASGDVYDIYGMTAAATLPLYSRVEIFNPQTGRKAIVTINDRLSDANSLIQLSYEAAEILGLQPDNPVVVVRGLPAQSL